MVNEATEHVWKGASREGNGESALFVDGIFLNLDNKRSEVSDKFTAINRNEDGRVWGRVKSRHG